LKLSIAAVPLLHIDISIVSQTIDAPPDRRRRYVDPALLFRQWP
jgi:hypothetical protein